MKKEYPIPKGREEVYKFYQLDFDKDGCPKKRVGNKLIFHPLYPTYLIFDYIRVFEKTGEEKYLTYAKEIVNLAWKYSSKLKDSSVFYYEPKSKLTIIRNRFYSALTQASWISALCKIERISPGSYASRIRGLYNSLLIEIKDGGVLKKTKAGWITEEYPRDPALITLNGWITVLTHLIVNIDVLKNIDVKAGTSVRGFIDRNLDAMEPLIPLYDIPSLNNTRYQLAGVTRLKLLSDASIPLRCQEFRVEIPGQGVFPGAISPGQFWSNYILSHHHVINYIKKETKKEIIFNIVLSMASFPEKSMFKAKIYSERPQTLQIYLGAGDYDPRSTALSASRWDLISGEIKLKRGLNDIAVKVPYDDLNLFAYPTNFNKRLDGKGSRGYNVYHSIHVKGLAQLYRYSKRKIFEKYSRLWLSYIPKWDNMPVLKKVNRKLYRKYDPLDNPFAEMVERILEGE